MSSRARIALVVIALLGAGLWLLAVPATAGPPTGPAVTSHAVVPAAPVVRHEPNDPTGGLRSLLPLALLLAALALAASPPSWRRHRAEPGPATRPRLGAAVGSRAPPPIAIA